MKTTLLFTSLLLFTALTIAQVRFVSKTSSSTPPYTSWETASDSIQKCINICNDGDTVVVANGTYRESLVISPAITLLGSGIDSCIIDGRGLASITIIPNKIFTIENFHIIGKAIEPLTEVIQALDNYISCKNLWIENAYAGIGVGAATITNCLLYNLHICISTSSDYNNDVIYVSNNVLLNNYRDGTGIHNVGGGLHYIYDNLIISCIPPTEEGSNFKAIDLYINKVIEVKNNLLANYNFYNYKGTTNCDTAIIENNVFIQNNTKWIGGINVAYLHSKKTSFRNNIVAFGKYYGIYATPGLVVDYNLFWKNGIDVLDGIILGEHNVFADPLFVKDTIPDKTPSYDFHLQSSSPAKDAGDPTLFDADGSRSDIGMYGGQLGEAFALLIRDLPPEIPTLPSTVYKYDELRYFIELPINDEKDFDHFNIYKDTTANFFPAPQNKFLETDTTFFVDYYAQPAKKVYYRATAVDKANNESLPSGTVAVTLTGIDEPEVEIVKEYKLHQNYPNPFNATTIIGYTLKESGYIKLTVYDIKGERITVLENGIKETGYHQVVFDAGKLASGIYIYRIEVTGNDHIPKYSDMKKLILLK